MNRENLQKLADYLLALPADYTHFDMDSFFVTPRGDDGWKDQDPTNMSPEAVHCGAVACAIGHGPAAGITLKEMPFSWYLYSDMVFDLSGAEWQWCFHPRWKRVDNTTQGAGKRIKYLLDHGLPENHKEQLHGREKLCYES